MFVTLKLVCPLIECDPQTGRVSDLFAVVMLFITLILVLKIMIVRPCILQSAELCTGVDDERYYFGSTAAGWDR